MRISTVIPVYLDSGIPNEIVERALKSVAEQTLRPVEIIVTDDSSEKFNVPFLVQAWADKFSIEVRYIKNVNERGLSTNCNAVMDYVQGDLLHILHTDDFLVDSDLYSRLAEVFTNFGANWVFLQDCNASTKFSDLSSLLFGKNDLGGPSGLIASRFSYLRYDDKLKMFLDTELYARMYLHYGPPLILDGPGISYGRGDWQTQRRIRDSQILYEFRHLIKKYGAHKDALKLVFSSTLSRRRRLILLLALISLWHVLLQNDRQSIAPGQIDN